MKGDLHEVKGKLDFMDCLNNVADLRYSMLSIESDSLKRQIPSGGVRSEKIVQQPANASKDVDSSIDYFNRHSTCAQRAELDTFRNTSVAFPEPLQTFFQQEVATLSNFVDEAAHDAFTSLHGDAVNCQSVVREL